MNESFFMLLAMGFKGKKALEFKTKFIKDLVEGFGDNAKSGGIYLCEEIDYKDWSRTDFSVGL